MGHFFMQRFSNLDTRKIPYRLSYATCALSSLSKSGIHSFLEERRLSTLRCQASAHEGDSEPHNVERDAAKYMVESYVRSGMTLGMGASGPAARAAIGFIAAKLSEGSLKDIKAVPLSNMAATELAFHGIPITSIPLNGKIDFAFDYVDEVDELDYALPVIKGRHGELVQPNVLQERSVIEAAELFVGFADEANVVSGFKGPVPIMIDGDYWEDIAEDLDDIFIGEATIWRRPEVGTAPPNGGDNPYITTNGENILDIVFEAAMPPDYDAIVAKIEDVPGVVAHGFYIKKTHAVIVIQEDNYRTLAPFLTVAKSKLFTED